MIEQPVCDGVRAAEPAGESDALQSQTGEEGRPSPSELFLKAACGLKKRLISDTTGGNPEDDEDDASQRFCGNGNLNDKSGLREAD